MFVLPLGHYICDAVDPEVEPSDITDRWFTYSDDLVSETCGAHVCSRRENSSYILFYKRQVSQLYHQTQPHEMMQQRQNYKLH